MKYAHPPMNPTPKPHDPRIAALAEAHGRAQYGDDHFAMRDHCDSCTETAVRILAALPPDWCGHAAILDANNADIRDRDHLLRNMRDTIRGHRICEENMDAEIAQLRADVEREQAFVIAGQARENECDREIATLRAALQRIADFSGEPEAVMARHALAALATAKETP